MKSTVFRLIYLLAGVLLAIGCRQENVILNFEVNTQGATATLQQIMYNEMHDPNEPTTLRNTYERFKIVHISDPHISDWTADNHCSNPTNVLEAVQFANLTDLRINALVATGDFISNMEKTTAFDASFYLRSFITALYTNNNVPTFVCTGNHDANMLTDKQAYFLSKQMLNSLLFNKSNYTVHQPYGENYYYADLSNPCGGTIRIIALDNTDQEGFDYNSLTTSCITQQQVDWLIQTALVEGMTDTHHVIILNHHPLQRFSKDQSTYMCSGTHLYGATLIPDVVNAFIQKKTWEADYQTTKAPIATIQVKADFSHAKGDFICYLGGHAHTPAHFEVTCQESPAPKQLMLLANTLSPEMQNNSYMYIKREKNALSSNSFSIYAIDTQEKNIYITSFGAKNNSVSAIETISYR